MKRNDAKRRILFLLVVTLFLSLGLSSSQASTVYMFTTANAESDAAALLMPSPPVVITSPQGFGCLTGMAVKPT